MLSALWLIESLTMYKPFHLTQKQTLFSCSILQLALSCKMSSYSSSVPLSWLLHQGVGSYIKVLPPLFWDILLHPPHPRMKKACSTTYEQNSCFIICDWTTAIQIPALLTSVPDQSYSSKFSQTLSQQDIYESPDKVLQTTINQIIIIHSQILSPTKLLPL